MTRGIEGGVQGFAKLTICEFSSFLLAIARADDRAFRTSRLESISRGGESVAADGGGEVRGEEREHRRVRSKEERTERKGKTNEWLIGHR